MTRQIVGGDYVRKMMDSQKEFHIIVTSKELNNFVNVINSGKDTFGFPHKNWSILMNGLGYDEVVFYYHCPENMCPYFLWGDIYCAYFKIQMERYGQLVMFIDGHFDIGI